MHIFSKILLRHKAFYLWIVCIAPLDHIFGEIVGKFGEDNWDILSTFYAYPAEIRKIIRATAFTLQKKVRVI